MSKQTNFISQNKYRYLFALAMAMVSNQALWSEHISQTQAQKMAQEFFAEKTGFQGNAACAAAAIPKLSSSSTATTSDDAFYIFNHADTDAFVIIASDDALPAVVGYSLTGTIDSDRMPDGLRAYLADYARVAPALASNPSSVTPSTKGGVAVAPLVNIMWDQDDPYNRLCPEDYNGRSYTGCVATAIAQLMKYHEFPSKGNGTVTDSKNRQVTLGHEYDWANMLDTYRPGSFSEKQATAVATLMRDVGYAVRMQYSSSASNAYSSDIAAALVRNFNYSKDIKYLYRTAFTTQGWIDEIRANLLRGEPVLYSGTDGSTGHQFLCDGIDANDLLHINWGWGGQSDGYFDMNILSPENLGIGAGGGAYYKSQDIVVNIHPGNPEEDNLTWLAPMTLMDVTMPANVGEDGLIPQGNLSLIYNIINSTGQTITFYKYRYALMVKDKNGKIIGYSGTNRLGNLYPGYYMDITLNLDPDNFPSNGKSLPDGEYCLSPILYSGSEDVDEATVNIPNGGDITDVWITRRDGKTYLNNKHIASNRGGENVAEIADVENNLPIYIGTGSASVLNITLRNLLPIAIDETFYLYLVPENEITPDLNPAQDKYYISNSRTFMNGTSEINVPFSIYGNSVHKAGRYRVFISNAKNSMDNVLPSSEQFYVTFKEFTGDQLIMTSALTISPKSLSRDMYVSASVNFSYNNPNAQFLSPIEIWIKTAGGPDNDMSLLFKSDDDIRFVHGSASYSSEFLSEEDALWYKDTGEYEAVLKYRNSDNEMVPFPGELNSAKFTIVETDSYDCLAELASPMVINGGNPVKAMDNAVFDIQFDIMSPTGISIDTTQEHSFLVKPTPYQYSEYCIPEFETVELLFSETELAPGETTTVSGKIRYNNHGNSPEYVGQTLYVTLDYINTADYVARLQTMPYIDHTWFRWSEDSAVSNIVVPGGEKPYTVSVSGGIEIRGLATDAKVALYGISGTVIIDNIYPDSSGNVSITDLPAGLYIAIITTPASVTSIKALAR